MYSPVYTPRTAVVPMRKEESASTHKSNPVDSNMRRRSKRFAPAPQPFPIEAFAKIAPVVQYAAELLNEDPKAVEISAYARVTLRRIEEILNGCYNGQSVSGLLEVFARAAVFLQLKYNTQPIDPRLLDEMHRIEADESGCDVNAPSRESEEIPNSTSSSDASKSTDISIENVMAYGNDIDDDNDINSGNFADSEDEDENEIDVGSASEGNSTSQSYTHEFDTIDVYQDEDIAQYSEKFGDGFDFDDSGNVQEEKDLQELMEVEEEEPNLLCDEVMTPQSQSIKNEFMEMKQPFVEEEIENSTPLLPASADAMIKSEPYEVGTIIPDNDIPQKKKKMMTNEEPAASLPESVESFEEKFQPGVRVDTPAVVRKPKKKRGRPAKAITAIPEESLELEVAPSLPNPLSEPSSPPNVITSTNADVASQSPKPTEDHSQEAEKIMEAAQPSEFSPEKNSEAPMNPDLMETPKRFKRSMPPEPFEYTLADQRKYRNIPDRPRTVNLRSSSRSESKKSVSPQAKPAVPQKTKRAKSRETNQPRETTKPDQQAQSDPQEPKESEAISPPRALPPIRQTKKSRQPTPAVAKQQNFLNQSRLNGKFCKKSDLKPPPTTITISSDSEDEAPRERVRRTGLPPSTYRR